MGNYSAKQNKQTVKVEGADEIMAALESMGDAASKVLLTAVMKGGDIALADAKQNCPVDTGALKESLKVSEKKSSNTVAVATVDYDSTIRYGTFVELGTKHNEPNPFMRNAVDDNIDKINETVAGEIVDAIIRKW
ncbi:MAG: HK97-gp10 family putative phage morphogenesis protein [Bacillota bacterium]